MIAVELPTTREVTTSTDDYRPVLIDTRLARFLHRYLNTVVNQSPHDLSCSARGDPDIPQIFGIVRRGGEGGVKGLDRFASA